MDIAARRQTDQDEAPAPGSSPEPSVANDNEIRRFRADLKSNPELAAAVLAQGTDITSVARLANAFGYAFTAAAFEDAMRSRTRRVLDDRELALKGASWIHMGAPGGQAYVTLSVNGQVFGGGGYISATSFII